MMTTHGLKRRTRRVWAAAAAAVLGVGALTGCAPDIGGLLESAIEDAVNSEGGDIDIEFNDGGISIEGSENGEEFAIDLGAGGPHLLRGALHPGAEHQLVVRPFHVRGVAPAGARVDSIRVLACGRGRR